LEVFRRVVSPFFTSTLPACIFALLISLVVYRLLWNLLRPVISISGQRQRKVLMMDNNPYLPEIECYVTNYEALTAQQRAVKRLFDIIFALILLTLLSPLMLIMTLAIAIDSPGPILFRQRRIGEGGRLFRMYKFRTMVWDAEAGINYIPNYKLPDDPRVTSVGKWLRRLSLDEIPQFINVLKGDMSLIGPRPELPQLVALYSSWQRKRFDVPQGITGWWQINGRADLPMYENVDYDIFYIRNYSVWLDLWIIARTPGALLQGRGAY
jgi:exopolysaccharide biosynthesis polyprenyl glycosylphosphotransferase